MINLITYHFLLIDLIPYYLFLYKFQHLYDEILKNSHCYIVFSAYKNRFVVLIQTKTLGNVNNVVERKRK